MAIYFFKGIYVEKLKARKKKKKENYKQLIAYGIIVLGRLEITVPFSCVKV